MKAIVLSSGGVDSTTCLALAVHELGKENVVTLSFEYGQRHSKELESAQNVADYYGVRHVVFNLTQIFSFSNCSLLSTSTILLTKSSSAACLCPETLAIRYLKAHRQCPQNREGRVFLRIETRQLKP